MAVTYSTACKNARLDAVTAQIGASGTLEIGTAGMGTVLATITLSNPAAPAASLGVLSFTMPKNATVANTGTAAAAQIKAAGTPVVTGLTVGTSGTDIIISGSASLTAGQTFTLSSASITSP